MKKPINPEDVLWAARGVEPPPELVEAKHRLDVATIALAFAAGAVVGIVLTIISIGGATL
jgi:hypothetical protein